jgi:hypothetical protein
MKYVAGMFACWCLAAAVVFTVKHQDEIRKENNAFARECNARGGMVRLDFNVQQCTK